MCVTHTMRWQEFLIVEETLNICNISTTKTHINNSSMIKYKGKKCRILS
jgi:hypothetical protein